MGLIILRLLTTEPYGIISGFVGRSWETDLPGTQWHKSFTVPLICSDSGFWESTILYGIVLYTWKWLVVHAYVRIHTRRPGLVVFVYYSVRKLIVVDMVSEYPADPVTPEHLNNHESSISTAWSTENRLEFRIVDDPLSEIKSRSVWLHPCIAFRFWPTEYNSDWRSSLHN